MDDEIRSDEEERPGVYELEDLEEEEEEPVRRQRLDADFLLDKVIPSEIDWRDLVRRHPLLSVGVAAAVGFLIGRSKGAAIVAGASAAVTSAVMRQLSGVLDTDVFEF
ncbi:MAG: glycine zipper domain-containing protein [Thermoanaerobaculum sp.]